ncbi:toxin-antitoxin system HicB family antitoxin [Rhodopirellula sp. MGV]|uniref:toxin-antitoxin system HicB family antitoxin n=1 Tax=Rhodopirellula sp. MGV TaxID=2023130 RepID=UPI000B96E1C0|nr:toxin-antitoxin system HicB family antitoxin [Rhodopirellula sp. MGV]OYP34422.1 hypothetical protein CGZ80_15350 [Rhodopirellula sp. MGV]PNY37403.1 toxin-antitoxin system HicB family antitoxin [Rhodopirellula baltica]
MTDLNPKEFNPLVAPEDTSGGSQLRYASDPDPDKEADLPTIELPATEYSGSYEDRCKQTLFLAEEAFAKTGSWVLFYRVVMGTKGVVQKMFSDPEEYKQFIVSEHYATLQEMLAAIRSQDQSKADSAEPERMITIRIPRSLHESLQVEAKNAGLSINKLSISKLLLPVNPRFIPEQQGRRRGRKPGPQGSRSKIGNRTDAPAPSQSEPSNRINFQQKENVREHSHPAHHWGSNNPQA